MLPGDFLHRIARWSCSTTTCERVIEPLLADLQREWLSADRPARRAMARIGGYASFWQTLLVCGARATPQMLTTRPFPIAMRTVFLMAFCGVAVFAAGWFRTGRLSWSEGISTPDLVPFWLGLLWPMLSRWGTRPSSSRPHYATVMLVQILGAALLCWFYPTRIYQVVSMSLTFLVLEPFIARGERSREILRQIDERVKQLTPSVERPSDSGDTRRRTSARDSSPRP